MDEWKKKVAALKAQREGNASRPRTNTGGSGSTPAGASSCSKCSRQLSPTAKFCVGCGTKVVQQASPASPVRKNTAPSTISSPVKRTPTTSTTTRFGSPKKSTSPMANRFLSKPAASSPSIVRSSSNNRVSVTSAKKPSDELGLTGTTEQKLRELKAKYDAKHRECEQVKDKLMSGLPKSSGSSGSSGSEVRLLEAKVKSLETKVSSEVRQRESAESRLKVAQNELKDMKERREQIRKRNITKASENVTRVKAQRAVNAQARRRGRGAKSIRGGAAVRSSRRSTRKMDANKGAQMQSVITRILGEMQRVEAAIKKAEEERQNAENELLEVACYKQAAEDRFSELQSCVQKMSVRINDIQILIATKCSGSPQIKQALTKLHHDLDEYARKATAISKGAQAASSAQVAQVAAAVGAPAPPGPPPPPALLQAMGSQNDSKSGRANHRASTLLTQIRKGASLKQIDVNAIKKEREEHATSHRKSVMMLNSLQDTLRSALATRHSDMGLDGEGDDDDDDDWDY
mmetsp:Transcript_4011/g.6012  ORF Transcript_4011/g.6012 Transcript_4011/m.6012 type:complete len:518 (+) Transcript_4011:12-1565(+)